MLGVVALDYNGLGFLMTRYPLEVIASFYHQLAAHVVNCQHIQPDKNRHSLGILKNPIFQFHQSNIFLIGILLRKFSHRYLISTKPFDIIIP